MNPVRNHEHNINNEDVTRGPGLNPISNGMNSTKMLIIGGIFIILVLGITQFFLPLFAVSPTLPSATSTPEQLSDATPASIIATTTVRIKKPSPFNPLSLVEWRRFLDG